MRTPPGEAGCPVTARRVAIVDTECRRTLRGMKIRTHLAEDEYLRKLGLVAYLVSSLEGLLLFDLPRFGHQLPQELSTAALAGLTTYKMGERFVTHAPRSADEKITAYFAAGGRALIEIAPRRNAMLHSRPATDPEGRTRLYRRHLGGAQPETSGSTTTGSIASSNVSTSSKSDWMRSGHRRQSQTPMTKSGRLTHYESLVLPLTK